MNCINLKIRTKNYQKYIYCNKKKQQVDFRDCKNCKYKEYNPVKKLKKKSKKQKELENKRFSIITNNLEICYLCNKSKKEDLHEIFGGCNRSKSMEWGMVIPVCRSCHKEWDLNAILREEIQQEAQKIFENTYSHELYMTEFKRNYL